MNEARSPESQVDNADVRQKKWQIVSAQVAILVTLVGLVAGSIKFLYQRGDSLRAQSETARLQAENAKRESQKPFLEKQLVTCFNVVGTVGSLAAEKEPGAVIDPKEHAKTLNQFWIHYHGILSVVENDNVEAAMVALGDQIRQCERIRQKCDLQNNANRLAHACRNLVRAGWDIGEVQYNQ